LSTTNPTWPDTGRRGGKPATNRLSYGSASTKRVSTEITQYTSLLAVFLSARNGAVPCIEDSLHASPQTKVAGSSPESVVFPLSPQHTTTLPWPLLSSFCS
jgi:hypothetical protein